MHDLIADLTKYLGLTPEQQFRVSAKIKRYIHGEKADLFSRYSFYSRGMPIFDRTDPTNPIRTGYHPAKDEWLHNILKEKSEQHAEWANKPDEEVITWSVGSFKYVQKVDPCSVCGAELTGKSYSRIYAKGVHATFCELHTPKEET